MSKKKLTRRIIIKTLVNSLEPIDYVHAFWEGGAAAFNRVDQWSDIDLYLVVDDDRINDTFNEIERSLKSLSTIEQKYETQQTSCPEIFQTFYKMKNTNKYLLIDLAVIKVSSPEKLLEPEIHGKVVFYFNKLDKIKVTHIEKAVITEKLRQRLTRLKARFNIFNIFVQKEINRDNALEAIDLFYNVTVSLVVEILRIKYFPYHHEFKMRYVHYELPFNAVKKLERLCFVTNLNDLQEKYHEATQWFNELHFSLENSNIKIK